MSSGAKADTNYDFTYSGSNNYSVIGVFSVDGSGIVQGITGTVSGDNPFSGNITGLLPVGSFGGYTDNKYSSVAPYITYIGVSFSTAGGNLNFYYDSTSGSAYYALNDGVAGDLSRGTMTSSLSGGAAPEMNASFIPQVALMLACLFFLFGRKKENTEPMLVA